MAMQTVSEVIRQESTTQAIRQKSSAFAPLSSPDKLKLREVVYQCPDCKDMGWMYKAGKDGQTEWLHGTTQIVRCDCQYKLDVERRRRRLEAIDGLMPAERGYLFGNAIINEGNVAYLYRVKEAVDRRCGLITLVGAPGRGKTHALMCAVNDARERHVPAVYTTMTDLLDYLRSAYNPNVELKFDARWDTLTRCEVLALDEVSEFNTTPWAMERFLRLMDERWRQMDKVLTLCATNGRLSNLPEKVASRLSDRRALVMEMKGIDMRKVMG